MMKNRMARSASVMGGVGLMAMSLLIAPSVVNAAPTAAKPKPGAACKPLNAVSGTGSNALKCVRNSKSKKLVWTKTATKAAPFVAVAPYKAPAGEIEFWHWRAEDKAVFDLIISNFESDNPGVKVRQVIMPTGDYQATALAKIRTNPKAAVFTTFRGAQFAQFAPTGIMRDLTSEKFMKNVNPNGRIAGQFNGRQLGVPYHYLFNNPVYNTEIFAKEGIKLPTNFSGVLAMCKTLKSKGYVPMAWPGATRGQAGQILNSMMMNAFTSYDQMLKSVQAIENGTADLSSAWFQEMAGKYAQMRDAGCFPDNPTGVNEPAANNLFATGRAAILPTGTFSMGTIKNLNPAMSGKMALMSLVATDSKPKYVGIHNNTFNLSVNAQASSTDQAIERAFLSFLLNPEAASMYANGTSQHVNVLGATYVNVDLLNTSPFQSKATLLAPRFLFLNQGVRDILEDALIAVVGGKDIKSATEEASKNIKQRIS
jgi:raffinose/stachyose/melibiose transport system substrate-binding protein